MDEATRRHYLALLEIPLWVARDQHAELPPEVGVEPVSDEQGWGLCCQTIDEHVLGPLVLFEIQAPDEPTTLAFLQGKQRTLLTAMLSSIGQLLDGLSYGTASFAPLGSTSASLPPEKTGVVFVRPRDLEKLGVPCGDDIIIGGVPCLTCWHPAYLLENPMEKRQAWAVMQRLAGRCG
ncbi:MAG: hypothetical protein MJA28_16515 [Gammaproteobacteria bacterium]|nr:hypothetical protein [Gammaproteobacteria bacterium]